MFKFLLEGASETIAENSVLGSEISDLLATLGFNLKSLPPDVKEGLQTVASIMKSEGLSDINETALQLCIERRKVQTKIREREEKILKARCNTVFAKYNDVQEKLTRTQSEVINIENILQSKLADNENTESSRILWSTKLTDYKRTIKMLEDELSAMNSQEIGPDRSFEKSNLLMEKLEELADLNKFLEHFSELPPNILQAKSVLQSKKQELEEIEHMINSKIN